MILLLGQALKSLVEHRQHGLHRQVTHNSPPTPPLPNHKTSPVAHSTITQCSRPAEFSPPQTKLNLIHARQQTNKSPKWPQPGCRETGSRQYCSAPSEPSADFTKRAGVGTTLLASLVATKNGSTV